MLTKRLPGLHDWLDGSVDPTLKQLEAFAKATHTPIGFLFLDEPPEERIPIPDFRTQGSAPLTRPSPNLLETIYLCQQRQEWYRGFARTMGFGPLSFVGSARTSDDIETVAADMREQLSFGLDVRLKLRSRAHPLGSLVERVDRAGIMVMVSGVVGSNNRRPLDPAEFRGFVLVDRQAPLIFVNGADSNAAQLFTLAHELAHLWLGESGLTDADTYAPSERATERWCNRVAAELLVPLSAIKVAFDAARELDDEVRRLGKHFKVSTLVILRRLFDGGLIAHETYQEAYGRELALFASRPSGRGGDYYRTTTARVSARFARALVVDTLEGQTLHRDAYRMLGISKHETFHELGHRLGVL